MSDQSKPSLHRQQGGDKYYDFNCPQCGCKFISKSGSCPYCRANTGLRGDDEILKKISDNDNDLLK